MLDRTSDEELIFERLKRLNEYIEMIKEDMIRSPEKRAAHQKVLKEMLDQKLSNLTQLKNSYEEWYSPTELQNEKTYQLALVEIEATDAELKKQLTPPPNRYSLLNETEGPLNQPQPSSPNTEQYGKIPTINSQPNPQPSKPRSATTPYSAFDEPVSQYGKIPVIDTPPPQPKPHDWQYGKIPEIDTPAPQPKANDSPYGRVPDIREPEVTPKKEKKGMFTRFKERRKMKAVAKDLDKLYGETIKSLLEHTNLAKSSYGEHKKIMDDPERLGKLSQTTANLKKVLKNHLDLLGNKPSPTDKDYEEFLKTKAYLRDLNIIEENLHVIATEKPTETAYFGKIHERANPEEAMADFDKFFGDKETEVVSLSTHGETDKDHSIKTHTNVSQNQNYWIQHSIPTPLGTVHTATIPIYDEKEKSLKHQIHYDPKEMKHLQSLPAHKERVGLFKVEVPNAEMIAWARDQIEGFRADKNYDGSTIRINGPTMDPNMVLAMQLYCKLKGYPAEGRPDILNSKENKGKIDKQVKVMEHVLTAKNQDPFYKPAFNPVFGMSEKNEQALEAKTDKHMKRLGMSSG